MTPSIRVYASDLTTDYEFLDLAYNIGYRKDRLDVGSGRVHVPHNAPSVLENPGILDGENLMVVYEDGVAKYPWLVRQRERERGDRWDEVVLSGPGAIELLRQAIVYQAGGLAGPPMDTRTFAWMARDYLLGPGWTTPAESLGTYANPTHASLRGNEGEPAVNDIQRVHLNADTSGFPWGDGSTYPSPGGLGGTFQLVFRGRTTSKLGHLATNTQIKNALEALSSVSGTVTVTGATTSTFDVEFGGSMGGKQQDLLSLIHSDLRHTHTFGTAKYVTRVQAGSKAVEAEGILEGWPDKNAHWLGKFGAVRYHRRELDVEATPANEGPVLVFVSSLGDFDVWFDGDHIGSGGSLDIVRFGTDLHVFKHVIGIRSDGPIIVTITRENEDGSPGNVLYRSQPSGWYWYGPDDPPGVSPGFILKTLFDEARARGYLPPVTAPSLSHTVDSLGRDWTVDLEVGLQVGTDSVLSALERMHELGVWGEMTPTLQFRAYEGVRVDRGATPGSGASTVTVGLDRAYALRTMTDDELLSVLLVRLSDSWAEHHRAGPRREGFLSLGSVPSVDAGMRMASTVLSDFLQPRAKLTWATHSGLDVPVAGDDYDIGDVIVGPHLDNMAADWSTADVMVNVIAVGVDKNGRAYWAHETSTP